MERPSIVIFIIGLNLGFIVAILTMSYYKAVCLVPTLRPAGLLNQKLMSHELRVHPTTDANVSDVRVLIWVMTSPNNIRTKALRVRETWGRRAGKLLFISSEDDRFLPAVGVNTTEGREHLTAKTMLGFQYVLEHHLNDADWFMKADDDTYVILENLRYFLSDKNTSQPVYYGHWFQPYIKQGYYSGGGGYVLSKKALKLFGNRGKRCREDGGSEDLEFGRCMQYLGVETADSRDALGRSRFHCMDPNRHLHGAYPDWYKKYDKFGAPKGPSSMSDYAISFHYVTPEVMRHLEYYVYHLRPYGGAFTETPGLDMNKPPNSTAPVKNLQSILDGSSSKKLQQVEKPIVSKTSEKLQPVKSFKKLQAGDLKKLLKPGNGSKELQAVKR